MTRFNRGDIHALREIYNLYKQDCLGLALVLVHEAADVVHDVFARMADTAKLLRIRDNLRGYLLTAVANGARQWLRRQHDRSRDIPATQGHYEPPEESIILNERQQRLAQALEQLPYEQQEVLVLRYFGGLTLKAIARSQKVSINTVQGRYRYGVEKLRSYLGGDL